MMFIVEEPNDLGRQREPGSDHEANDTLTRKIIDFEAARKALEHGEPRIGGPEERSWLVRRIGVSWFELSLTVTISFALLVFWFAAVMWL